jgi:hypothetical protein
MKHSLPLRLRKLLSKRFVFVLLCSIFSFEGFSQVQMATGYYLGDGLDNHLISVGFQPDIVIVKMGDGGNEAQIRTSNMAPGISKQMVGDATAYTDRIKNFTGSGFTVGIHNDANRVGKTFYWTAIKASADIVLGSYTGDGNDDRNITGLSFTPQVVIVIPLNDHKVTFKTSTMAGENSAFFGASASLDNTLQALIAGGFQIGDHARTNKAGDTYLYIALKQGDGIKVGSYPGNGVDPTTITGVGFRAEYLFIKSSSTNRAVQKSNVMPDVSTVEFDNSREDDNRIHSLNNDGWVVGKQAQVNANGNTYHYVAFRNTPALSPGPCMSTGSYVGDGTSNKAITGLGFHPNVIIVKGDFGQEAQISTSGMASGYSRQMVGSASEYLDRIKSFDADGFTVGSNPDVNKLGKTYYYTAFQTGPNMVIGNYTGNGIAGTTINGVGFQPDVVFVLPESPNRATWRSSTFTSAYASAFGSDFTLGNTITAFAPDGFVIGSDNRANHAGLNYNYVAFKQAPDFMKVGLYQGDGIDGHTISDVGFQAKYLFIKSTGGNYATQKSDIMDDDVTIEFTGSKSDDNRIHSVNPTGFVLGTQGQVNAKPNWYHYVAFKGCGAPVVNTRMAGTNTTVTSNAVEGLFNPRQEIQNTVSVFPNPVRNSFNLKLSAGKQEAAIITISDFNGKTVMSKTIPVKVGENNIPVNVSNLSPGMYMVKLSRAGNVQSVKILISR